MTTLALILLARTVLSVGDGKQFARIEDAVNAAHPGDTIEVFAKAAGYGKTAILLSKAGIHFQGMEARPTIIDGTGYDYTGAGSVPRAIFQFNPGSDGSSLMNFDLRNAHNDSFNGAGVRINQANHILVARCAIHGNDMGIMSNGLTNNPTAASGQVIDGCTIFANGNAADPGYNHNLYLGGTSVTVEFCNIFGSLTGHNLKSRAHFNLIQYNYIHHSSNRELDLVEAWDTERADSNAVLIGNLIEKDPNCSGNRATIQFGAESGVHNGTLYLLNNTIVTPFISGVVALTSNEASAQFYNNVVFNGVQNNPSLADLANGAVLSSVSGGHNWISKGYSLAGTLIDSVTRWEGQNVSSSPGFALGDFNIPNQPTQWTPFAATYVDGLGVRHGATPTLRYMGAGAWRPSSNRFIGAG